MSSLPKSVCKLLACARTCVRAPQSVFDFFLHSFTRVRQLLDSKRDRGEGFVRKREDFLHFLGVFTQLSIDFQWNVGEEECELVDGGRFDDERQNEQGVKVSIYLKLHNNLIYSFIILIISTFRTGEVSCFMINDCVIMIYDDLLLQ